MADDAHVAGRRAVLEALITGVPVNRVYLADAARGPEIDAVKTAARARGVRYDFVDVGKLGALTGTRDHQDVVARLSPVAYASLDDVLTRLEPGQPAVVVALDQVQHPGNAGMVARTAAAAGAAGLLLPTRGGRLVNAEVVRASAGAVFRLPVVATAHLGRDLETLKEHGFWVYGLDAEGPVSLYGHEFPSRCVLVAGNESRGLRPSIGHAVDANVRIPLASGVESLNVAVAVAVALFEVRRQRG